MISTTNAPDHWISFDKRTKSRPIQGGSMLISRLVQYQTQDRRS